MLWQIVRKKTFERVCVRERELLKKKRKKKRERKNPGKKSILEVLKFYNLQLQYSRLTFFGKDEGNSFFFSV